MGRTNLTTADIEAALRAERERKDRLTQALYAAACHLWFAAAGVASKGWVVQSKLLQRHAWDAERVARGLESFVPVSASEVRGQYADELPPFPED